MDEQPEENEKRVEQEKVLLSWRAPSRPYRGKSAQFLVVPFVIVFLFGLILFAAQEYMVIAALAALAFAYYAWSVIPPEEVDYVITTRGLRIAGQLYGWEMMTRWWVVEQWGHQVVAFEAPGLFMKRVVVSLGEVPVKKVEAILEDLLLHEKPADTFMDKAGRWMSEKFPLEKKI